MAEYSDWWSAAHKAKMSTVQIAPAKIAIAYRENFLDGDAALLLLGDARAIESLVSFFSKIASKTVSDSIALSNERLFACNEDLQVVLSTDSPPFSMRYVSREPSRREFIWRMSPDIAAGFEVLTRTVAETPHPCHQYLEADDDEVVVILSKDEYGSV